MKKSIMLLALISVVFFGAMSAGEINDEFGAEVIDAAGNTRSVIIHNRENKNIWVALFAANNANPQSMKPVFIAKQPTLQRPGSSATANLTANTGQESILAVWYKDPAKVTISKGRFFGYNITPTADVTHRLSPSDKNIFLQLSNGKIQEQQ